MRHRKVELFTRVMVCVIVGLLLGFLFPRAVFKEEQTISFLELPALLRDALSQILPSAYVDDADIPLTPVEETLIFADRDVSEADLSFERKVVISIHDYEDAISIIEEIPHGEMGIQTIGTFVISDETLDSLQQLIIQLKGRYGQYGFLLLDLETGAGLYYNIDEEFYCASCIKAINLSAICYYYPEALSRYYTYMRSAIVNSNNECYAMISRAYPASIRNDWRHRAHLGDQTNGTIFQYLTIRELAQLWCVTWDYLNQEGEGPDTMREWLTDTYQSCFAAQLGVRDGYEIHSKAGWTFGYDLTSSEGGYVISPGGTYLLVVMTNRSGSPLVNLASLVPALDRVYQEYAPQKAIH